ncbi:MAG: MucR family transcriptional regulator [Alphaproteobacteria bacterium]|nr:MucR family transcriptional regulator [Alphaproteobacteria bacterium]
MTTQTSRDDLLAFTTEIVSAYLANNTMPSGEIPGVIEQVFKTLANVNTDVNMTVDRPQPAVPIKKSITPDYLICLEDGKKLKMLKRHLKTAYGMTPDDYRERWGLPADYPMVAPNYAEQRSKLAKDIGLGTRGRS